jgi:hypothetical protein
MYNEIIELIKNAGESVDFAPFGEGISEEWIKKAEKRLNVEFPMSYKWWLSNYNGGEVFGEEIYSVYGIDFDSVVGGDIVYINELSRKNDSDFLNKIIISEPQDSLFYFDISNGLIDGEYPIYEYYTKERYAISFLEFLKRRILDV